MRLFKAGVTLKALLDYRMQQLASGAQLILACPLSAWLLKKYAGITLSGWARFGIAILFIVIGRLALKIEGGGAFLPGP
jgi:cytidylate kinase